MGFILRIISLFTGNALNTLVIIGLFLAFYMTQSGVKPGEFDTFALYGQINAVISGAPSKKAVRTTADPRFIRVQ